MSRNPQETSAGHRRPARWPELVSRLARELHQPVGAIATSLLFLAVWTVGLFVVRRYLPDYVLGYVAYLPAVGALLVYWKFARLGELFTRADHRMLLVACYLIPLANTVVFRSLRYVFLRQAVVLEVFRPEIVLLGIACALTVRRARKHGGLWTYVPLSLKFGLVCGSAGFAVSTLASAQPLHALGVGIFEFVIPWLVFFAFFSQRAEQRLIWHALHLTALASLIVFATGILWMMIFVGGESDLGVPLLADAFLDIHRRVDKIEGFGLLTMGNSFNLVLLAVPVASLYLATSTDRTLSKGVRTASLAACVLTLYTILLCYSRSGLLVILLTGACLFLLRLWAERRLAWSVVGVLALLLGIHVPGQISSYYKSVGESLVLSIAPTEREPPAPNAAALSRRAVLRESADVSEPDRQLPAVDKSTLGRVFAMAKGWTLGRQLGLFGAGYGSYPRLEPEWTSPHNSLIQRWVEGGVLSLIGLLCVAAFLIGRIFALLRQREPDMVTVAGCSMAGAFLLLAALAGGTFSMIGLIHWGFIVHIALAATCVTVRHRSSTAAADDPRAHVPSFQ